MFLDYFALFLVFFVVIVIFYGIILIHDIPYEIAVHRDHPHQDAIHAGGWVSLFTLHAIWPFLWIWATLYKPGIGWGFKSNSAGSSDSHLKAEVDALKNEIAELKNHIATNQSKED